MLPIIALKPLLSKVLRYLLIGGVIAAAIIAYHTYITNKSYDEGYGAAKTFYTAIIKEMDEKAERINEAEVKNSEKAGADAAKAEVEIKIVYKDRIKEVIKYVETVPDARTPIGAEWVYEHDKLAAQPGESPPERSAYGADSAAAAVTKAQALETIGVNYEQYYQCLARVKIWEMFDQARRDEFNK